MERTIILPVHGKWTYLNRKDILNWGNSANKGAKIESGELEESGPFFMYQMQGYTMSVIVTFHGWGGMVKEKGKENPWFQGYEFKPQLGTELTHRK